MCRLLGDGQLAGDNEGLKGFLSVTRGLTNIKVCQLTADGFLAGLVDFFGGGHGSLQRLNAHREKLKRTVIFE